LSPETIRKLRLCTSERLLPKDLEKVYHSVSRPKWGMLEFILQLAREIGRAKLVAVAKRAERERLAKANLAVKMRIADPEKLDLDLHVWGKNGAAK
jgi:hypothetical protein